jgi:hypothetical protein
MLKKILIIFLMVFPLMIPIESLSAPPGFHEIQLRNFVPFSVPDEFPQFLEGGPFVFRLAFSGASNSMDYRVILANSTSDANYRLLFLGVSLDNNKIKHIVALMSGNQRGSSVAKDLFAYRDEQFFKTGEFSGVLTKCMDFPTPKELEQAFPKRNTI